jgi:REP element-mobilizing transposase RayT
MFEPIFRNESLANILLSNLRFYSASFTIKIHAFVIMPNHLHLLVTGGERVSQFMGRLKQYSARQIINWCQQSNKVDLLNLFSSAATKYKTSHEYHVWQSRFDNFVIAKQEDLMTKLNYIHNNPLQERWKLCDRIEDYRFSSARYYFSGEEVGVPIVRPE